MKWEKVSDMDKSKMNLNSMKEDDEMDCEEIRVDIRKTDPQDRKEGQRCAKLLFQLNHTMP